MLIQGDNICACILFLIICFPVSFILTRHGMSTFNSYLFFSNYCSSTNGNEANSSLLKLLEIALLPSFHLTTEPSDIRKQNICDQYFYSIPSSPPQPSDTPSFKVNCT